jgi:hypothetical protein
MTGSAALVRPSRSASARCCSALGACALGALDAAVTAAFAALALPGVLGGGALSSVRGAAALSGRLGGPSLAALTGAAADGTAPPGALAGATGSGPSVAPTGAG